MRVRGFCWAWLLAFLGWLLSANAAPAAPTLQSVWGSAGGAAMANDPNAIELGVKFRSDLAGYIYGVRFYKGTSNTGTHRGNLWTRSGGLLASATFTNETASGWQEVRFAAPVAISANTTYVASYFAPVGRYAYSSDYFRSSGVDAPPLHFLRDGVDGGNGVYRYGSTSGFPSASYLSANYWVDVLFSTSPPGDTTPPLVSSVSPSSGASGVSVTSPVSATFNEPMDPATLSTSTFLVRSPGNVLVPGSVTYDGATRRAVFQPGSVLAYSTTYTASIVGGGSDPRAKDAAGNALASTFTWQFTTQPAPGAESTAFNGGFTGTGANDSSSIEVGVKFRSDTAGYILGVRFYKSSLNIGTHKGSLWTRGGGLLASATFVNETASGWQEVRFASPVAISANTTYVASYFAPKGKYAYSSDYFKSSGVDVPPLHLLRDGIDGGNGVYRYTAASAFPNASYASANYWVDPVFSTSPTSLPPGLLASVTFPGALQLGSAPVTGTVNLASAQSAPVSVGLVVQTGGGAVASLPASVTVPAGSTSASFSVGTNVVAALTGVQVKATLGSTTQVGGFTVRPPGARSLGFAPGVIAPGAASGGYLVMEAPVAQATVVNLSVIQADPSWLTIPSSVTVPAGSRLGNFGSIASPALAGTAGTQVMVMASTPYRSTAGLVSISGNNAAFDPAPETPGLPRALIIGDSISIGYTQPARSLLSGQVNVQRIPCNAGMTTRALQNIDEWLGSSHWDVIHFNCGLWDIEDLPDGSRLVPLAEYEQNLRALVTRLKQTGAKLVWASTTPVPSPVNGPPRSSADVIAYNAVALKVMQENGVQVDDLYTYILPNIGALQIPSDVHFTSDGYNALAIPVADSIRAALGL